MKRYRQWLIGAVALCMVAPVARAGTGAERLHDFFAQVKSLRADFEQTVVDAHQKVVERAQGAVALQRPGKFRWDYRAPYEQAIVANGKKVWIYDKDLEQVTVKALDAAVGATPAQLLSTDQPLEQSFAIVEVGATDGIEWVELTPKDRDTNFSLVRLGFDARNLQQMELIDSFGQTTRLRFKNIARNPALEPSTFEFKPPPGIDVIGE